MKDQRGQWSVGPVIGIIVLVLAIIGLFAVCNDEENDVDGLLGRVELVSHDYDDDGCWEGECSGGGQDYDYDYGSHDRNRNRGRDRGAFSPDLQDSPVTVIICPPGTQYCGSDGEGRR